MRFFSSTFTNPIDKKGRVSIPAPFRKVLEQEAQPGLWLIPQVNGEPAVDGLGAEQFGRIADALASMNPFDRVNRALTAKTIGRAVQVTIDDTGRIVLPEPLRELLELDDKVLFVGMIHTFQIWKPETHAAWQEEIEATALANTDRLPWGRT
ncbi:MAG: division/cell wall cluster transcriptional repressor MraZ [Rhodobacteraceae bacterium]|nr:MAG: division/cell wall cluster transcriptional repressor MraZ [Paracoccaceae bacterium]